MFKAKHINKLSHLFSWYPFYIWREKAMAPHSSIVAWKIPWMEEPGGLQSMGSLRVRHDWVTSLSLSIFMHWRRKWQPTPVFLPGESHGQRSLVGCSPWGCTELDTTEATWQQAYTHTHTHLHTHVHTHTFTHTFTHIHIYTLIHTVTHTYTHIHIYTHAHTHMYTHIYTHT